MKIDPQFKAEIPPIQEEELRQLKDSLRQEGCRDSLVIWNDTLLDGHNRYELCLRYELDYTTRQAPDWVKTRDDALDYIRRLQLGRRNLTLDDFRLLLGRRYNAAKKGDGQRGPKKLAQCEQAFTADKIAAEHGVSRETVKRAGKLAKAYDNVKEAQPKVTAKDEKEVMKMAKEIIKQRARQVLDKGVPELVQAVERGAMRPEMWDER